MDREEQDAPTAYGLHPDKKSTTRPASPTPLAPTGQDLSMDELRRAMDRRRWLISRMLLRYYASMPDPADAEDVETKRRTIELMSDVLELVKPRYRKAKRTVLTVPQGTEDENIETKISKMYERTRHLIENTTSQFLGT